MKLQKGEAVVLVDGRGKRYLVTLTGKSEAVPRLGVIGTAQLEGAEEGSVLRVGAIQLTVLRPTATDLVASIERRAQIILPKDAAMIALHADVKAGDLVVEGGAGSGALSVFLLRLLRPGGRLVSYEVREDHAELVRSNVARAGLSEGHTVRLADITKGIEEREVDAVVLDLPEPWDAIPAATVALRPGGRLVSYSPTVGQVERTHGALRAARYTEPRTFEVLERDLVVGPQGTRPSFDMLGHSGYITAARRLA